MDFNSIKTFIVAAVFGVCTVASFGSASASTMSNNGNGTVFGAASGTISPTVTNTTPDSGDRYVAVRVNGAGPLLFVTPGGTSVTTNPTPFSTGGTPAGTSAPLFNVNSLGLAPGTYQVIEVDTDAGADPFDSSKWHAGSLNVKNFSVGQSTAVSGDIDGDGFPDDDANHDGFHDDDKNFNGFHDDDDAQAALTGTQQTGLHPDDLANAQLNGTAPTGFHPDDPNHTGFHPDDLANAQLNGTAPTGFHPNDLDHDGFADDDLNHDGFHDGDLNHDGFDNHDSNHDGFVDANDDGSDNN